MLGKSQVLGTYVVTWGVPRGVAVLSRPTRLFVLDAQFSSTNRQPR